MGNISIIFLLVSGASAVVHSIFIWKKFKKGLLPTKIVMMVSLALWAVLTLSPTQAIQKAGAAGYLWFLAGIVFCLIGDIFLEFPPEKWFKPGLVSFLVGQICYVIGFGNLIPQGPVWAAALLALGIAAEFVFVTRKLLSGLRQSGQPQLRIPIIVYALCISLMLYSAAISLIDARWDFLPALLVALGALSFYVSDVMNAWSRFVGPIANHRLKIMITYHLAQLLIQIGIVMHFMAMLGG
jgi:uncharacterized membrane protein YhhN